MSEHPELGHDEVVDIEAYARSGRPVPHAERYRLRINKQIYGVDRAILTGAEILALAGLMPADQYLLRLKASTGSAHKIEPDEKVDLREPGVERFVAQKREVQDGA
jgi:hypothetical protein